MHDTQPDWQSITATVASQVESLVLKALRDAARSAWGRGVLRRSWEIVTLPSPGNWRAYRYVGSPSADEHWYVELGVTCHVAPDHGLVGFGVDNGVDFIAIHDTSASGLSRGLDYVRRQRLRVRSYGEPRFGHRHRDTEPGLSPPAR